MHFFCCSWSLSWFIRYVRFLGVTSQRWFVLECAHNFCGTLRYVSETLFRFAFICKLIVPVFAIVLEVNCTEIVSNYLTNSTEQSPSWEADSLSASEEILPLLWNPECSLPCSQEPTTGPYSDPDASTPLSPPYFSKIPSNIILPSMLRSSELSFPSGFRIKILYEFLISSCVLHILVI